MDISNSKQLLKMLVDSGCYFGHRKSRRNPQMNKMGYIHSTKDHVDIIDLRKTVGMLTAAYKKVSQIVSSGGRILFVGTKKQAQEIVKDEALRCAQYYVNHRWLGGTLTNWFTISKSIGELDKIEKNMKEGAYSKNTKRERLGFQRRRDKLSRAFSGIKEIGGVPDGVFIVDICEESTAVKEARKLQIPVFGIVDSNANPKDVDYPIPGNDDSKRSIATFCKIIADGVLSGLKKEASKNDDKSENVEDSLKEDVKFEDEEKTEKS
jgi:small subunit ribosomal protein S2